MFIYVQLLTLVAENIQYIKFILTKLDFWFICCKKIYMEFVFECSSQCFTSELSEWVMSIFTWKVVTHYVWREGKKYHFKLYVRWTFSKAFADSTRVFFRSYANFDSFSSSVCLEQCSSIHPKQSYIAELWSWINCFLILSIELAKKQKTNKQERKSQYIVE